MKQVYIGCFCQRGAIGGVDETK